ncbi:MAG: cortex morphogenetic protein CmpA [Thermoflavifilum sp.]|nr:cortex morphogenetic protein CmpA [Thermoflavifilum sp.]MCL6513736.1 cortex morphogenetic protein CmpA [Alicyclobacillus sp.]
MPEWLRKQLKRAFFSHDVRAIRMLNQAFFKYRRPS